MLSLLLVCFTFLSTCCIFEKDNFVEVTAEQKSKLTTDIIEFSSNFDDYTEITFEESLEFQSEQEFVN